ncbi:MAG: right-handed parallel beta-helix repeat-containing protein, partial [Gemmatimonadetes bacterium]|nr:right-handed parallel beta-helix repeat-containing protein [Gemmatimonadota bacterium]
MPAPEFPSGAKVVPIPEEGTLQLDGSVRVIVPMGGAEGDLNLAFWRPPAVPGMLDKWKDKVRPVGQPFALSVVGQGVLNEGRLEVDVVDGEVPEGWELRLLQYAPNVHPMQLPQGAAPSNVAQPPWMLTCARGDNKTLSGDFLAFMPEYRDKRYYQLAAVRAGTMRELKVASGETWLCLHLIDPPVHGDSAYAARVLVAFETARDSARDMGFRLPRTPVAVTVTRESYTSLNFGPDKAAAVAFGNLIALRNDLHTWLPRETPGQLERAAAHEFFHVVQYHTMTEPTMNSTEPGGGNRWAIEGAATWFAWRLYPGPSKGLARPTGKSLKTDPYGAWAFWAYLEERHPGVLREVYTLAYGHALGSAGVAAGGPTKPDQPPRVISAYEWLDLAEVLDAVLRDRGTDLSTAFAHYAVSLLFKADFARGDQGNTLFPGLWYGQDPMTVRPGAVTHTTLTGTREDETREWNAGEWIGDELSAHALQITSPFEVGVPHVRLSEVMIDGVQNGSRVSEIQFTSFYGKPDEVQTLVSVPAGYVLTENSRGIGIQWPEGGLGTRWTLILINAGWTKWTREPEDPPSTAVRVARPANGVDFEVAAYLHDRPPPRSPIGPLVSVSGSRKTHCVSQDADDDECIGATITMALDNDEVKDGDIIEIHPGHYPENLVIKKAVALVGTEPGGAIVSGPNTVVKIDTSGVTLANLVLISTSGFSTSDVVSGLEAHDARILSNVIVNGSAGGVFFDFSHGVEIVGNWIAVPRLGIRVWNSLAGTVKDNVVFPATVREDIQEVRVTATGVEWPGTDPWTLTDKAIDISSSFGIDVEGNVIGPATSQGGRGYDTGIRVLRSDGVNVVGNTAHVYNTGIFAVESSDLRISNNMATGLNGVSLSDAKNVTIQGNRAETRWEALTLAQVEEARLTGNSWTGGAYSGFAVQVNGAEGLRVFHDTVIGVDHNRGGMHLNGGAGVSIIESFVSGWSLGLQADSTVALNVTASTLEQRRKGDNPNWESAALALYKTSGVTVEQTTLRGNHRALVVDDVRFFEPELLVIDAPFATAITARGSRIRGSFLWLHPDAHTIFVAKDSEIRFERV